MNLRSDSTMPQPQFVFVVDGGGTKTEAELRRLDGTVLAAARTGPCNLYQDAQAAIASVRAAWAECGGAAREAETIISAGIAGSSAAGAPALFHSAFAGSYLSGDGYTALVGAFGAAPGALLSIGTGVVGCRFDAAGRYTQLGGWGFPVGDLGGGAWLGLHLVGAWLEHLDGSATERGSPALWHAVAEKLGGNRREILAWLRAARPDGFASLVPDLLREAEAGCDVALRLRAEAVAHVARLGRAISGEQQLPVALSGGLAPSLEPYLRAELGERLQPLRRISPLDGAWRIALGERGPEFPLA